MVSLLNITNMKTKQFNYEEAKANPELVVYRNGEKPLQVSFMDISSIYKVVTVDGEGDILTHTENGNYLNGDEEDSLDLLLIDTTPKSSEPEMWVNVYDDDNGTCHAGSIFPSKADCNIHISDNCIGQYKLIKG